MVSFFAVIANSVVLGSRVFALRGASFICRKSGPSNNLSFRSSIQVSTSPALFMSSKGDNQINIDNMSENELEISKDTTKTSANPPLIRYRPGMDVGTLEDWPFENPSSNYVMHDNTSPKASGRIDHSTATTRTGIWKCTVGKMECTEQGEELMTILSGKVEVTDVSTGQVVLLQPGDSMFSYNGKRLIWNVLEDVTKVFYGSKADGYS